MGEFDDLFERPIPIEEVTAYLGDLQKLAAGPEWVSRAARGVPEKVAVAPGANQNAKVQQIMLRHHRQSLEDRNNQLGNRPAFNAALGGTVGGTAGAAAGKYLGHGGRVGAIAGGLLGAGALGTAMYSGAKNLQRRRQHGIDAIRSIEDLSKTSARRTFWSKVADAAAALQQGGPPLAEPAPEQVIMAEQRGLLEQTAMENEALHGKLQESQALIEQHASQAEEAQAMVQQTQGELQEAQATAQQAQMQSEQAMSEAQMQAQQAQQETAAAQQEAQMQAATAAQQADGKMRLAIRLQQMRQQLADMASQDPVAEEGEQAEPIMTAGQQGMDPAADPAAAEAEAAAAGDPAAGGAPGGAPPGAAPDPAAAAGPSPAPDKTAGLIGRIVKNRIEAAKQLLRKKVVDTRTAGIAKVKEVVDEGRRNVAAKIAPVEIAAKPKADRRFAKGVLTGVAGTGAAGGTAFAVHRHREKKATEAQLRSDARRSSGTVGALQGAALGGALSRLTGKGSIRTAGSAAIGAALGHAHGRAGFDKRELTHDLALERALTRGRRERADKRMEKDAGLKDTIREAGRRLVGGNERAILEANLGEKALKQLSNEKKRTLLARAGAAGGVGAGALGLHALKRKTAELTDAEMIALYGL